MAKISYANMKLKVNNDIETFNFKGNDIEVLQYLPIDDKYSLINITLQKSLEDGIYNPLKLDVFFHLHLVYMYTNISFTEKQKEDEFRLFDVLKSNGFIDAIVAKIPQEEYEYLLHLTEELIEIINKYKNTAVGLINKMIDDLPANAQAAMDIVEQFDPDKFQAVRDFAKAANGGREI